LERGLGKRKTNEDGKKSTNRLWLNKVKGRDTSSQQESELGWGGKRSIKAKKSSDLQRCIRSGAVTESARETEEVLKAQSTEENGIGREVTVTRNRLKM